MTIAANFLIVIWRSSTKSLQLRPVAVLSLVLASLLGYFLGSIPTAYLLVRWKSNVDIRGAGSGNVGTLNSYVVTKSKWVGAAVLVGDLLKGVLAVLLSRELVGTEFSAAAAGGFGAVFGHNFPVWLKFKGGRGLATAAGAMLLLGWVILPIWMITWFVGHKLSRDINVGNAIGSIVTLLFVLFAPAELLEHMMTLEGKPHEFTLFMTVLFLLILVRLVEPVREYITSRQKAR